MDGVRSCYKCEDRFVGCHSTCDRYLKEKQEYDERKEKYRLEDKKTYGKICVKDFVGSPPRKVSHKININMSKRKYGN